MRRTKQTRQSRRARAPGKAGTLRKSDRGRDIGWDAGGAGKDSLVQGGRKKSREERGLGLSMSGL